MDQINLLIYYLDKNVSLLVGNNYLADLMRGQVDDSGWVTKLYSRKVISLRGPDSTKFLQGLITQDMSMFDLESKDRAAIYTAFLNVKGKILFDAIIVKPLLANQNKEDMEYWIDIADYDIEDFQKHLKKYSIRKKIQVVDISDVIKSYSI